MKKDDPIKFCIMCGALLERKRFNGRLEDRGVFLRRQHCGQSCANSKEIVGKAAHHRRAQKYRAEKCCECGSPENLHVHHLDEDWSNDKPANLITICASCHLKGHWKEWKAEGRQISQRKVICCRGHRMEGDNVYIRPGNGMRECRECNRERSREYYQSHRQSAWSRKQTQRA